MNYNNRYENMYKQQRHEKTINQKYQSKSLQETNKRTVTTMTIGTCRQQQLVRILVNRT